MTMRDETIVGGAALEALLGSLPVKIEKNILRAALRAGAVVMRDETKARVPVKLGALRDSVRITSRVKKGRVTVSVKAGNSIAYYAHMVEFGTRPHLIKINDAERGINRRTGKALSMKTVNRRMLAIGGRPIGPSVQHPGARPHPFMRPAADAALQEAVAAVQAKVRERLTKQGLDVPASAPMDAEE